MRSVILGVVAGLSFLASPALAVENRWDVISKGMQEISKKVVENDEYVEFARPIWDEKFCHLGKEKLRYTVIGELKSSPWTEKQRSAITGTLTLEGKRAERPGLEIHSHSKIETNTLDLFRYVAKVALDKVNKSYESEKFKARVVENLTKFNQVRDLTELFDLLEGNVGLSQEIVASLLADAEADLAATPEGDPSKEYYVRKVADLKQVQKAYAKLKFGSDKSEKGVVSAIEIEHDDPSGFIATSHLRFDTRKISAVFTEKAIEFHIYAFVDQTLKEMDRLHEDLEEVLLGMHAHDKKQEDRVHEGFTQALKEFKRVINGRLWN